MPRTYRSVTAQMIHYLVRPHTGRPEGPVVSPAAWSGDELTRRSDWVTALTPDEVREAEEALRFSRSTGKTLHAIGVADFPLPTLRARIRTWTEALATGCGVQLVRGVPVERWSQEECERFFFGLGLHLGTPGAQNRDEELLGHVRDEGLSYRDPSVRGFRTADRLAFHCDGADVVGLLCLRTAKSGGRSRFASSVRIYNELQARRPELAARLFHSVELDTRGDGGLNFVPVTPCRHASGTLRTFYHADYFRTASQHPGARPLGALERELFDRYDEIASSEGMALDMDFRPGEIQLLNNHFVVHSRTAYEDHEEPERRRHLLRLWLSLPREVPLRERPSMAWDAARLVAGLVRGRLRDRAR